MREIRFRLIRDNKIVGYEKHIYFTDIMSKNKSSVYIYHSRTSHELSWHRVSFMDEKYYLKHDDKNQYTGLKDSKNREIYEGDILKTEGVPNVTVFWYEQEARFQCAYHGLLEKTCDLNDTISCTSKVINNIYRNPEPSKEKNE